MIGKINFRGKSVHALLGRYRLRCVGGNQGFKLTDKFKAVSRLFQFPRASQA